MPRGERAAHVGPSRRRPQVLERAADLFHRLGYSTSMAELAGEVGVVKAVLYDCFPGGKVELQRRLMERAEQRFQRNVVAPLEESHEDVEHFVRSTLRSFVAFATSDTSAFELLFGAAEMDSSRSRARLRTVRIRTRTRFSDLVAARLDPIPPETTSPVIVGTAIAVAQQALEDPDQIHEAVIEDAAGFIAHAVQPRVRRRAKRAHRR